MNEQLTSLLIKIKSYLENDTYDTLNGPKVSNPELLKEVSEALENK